MADLTDLQAATTVKLAGANASGVESNFMEVDADQRAQVRVPSEGTPNGTIPTTAIQIAGSDGLLLRTVKTDDEGRLQVSGIPNNASFSYGYVQTSALTKTLVNATVYTEQTTNAQRSIASASANDTAAGTGARTVRITYYTATFTGPFTTDVTLNGVAYVNTTATDICYIERIDVLTAGSGGVNAGILTLKAATAGGGATIGTVAVGNNKTMWAHHYVKTGIECFITAMSVSHNGTTVGSGATFVLNARVLNVANAADRQISDFVRLYGQASTSTRSYGSPITLIGPAVIRAFVTPETASSTNYRASFDFFEP